MRYLRYSILVGVPEEEFPNEDEVAEVVSTDLREIIQGDMDPADLSYGIVVSDIDYRGDESK